MDIWLAETQSSLEEARLIQRLLADDPRPLWISLTLSDDPLSPGKLRSNEPLAQVVAKLNENSLDALLFNCSAAEVMEDALHIASQALGEDSPVRLGTYANSFTPITEQHQANQELTPLREDLTPEAYLEFARSWVKAGASIIGGCCGISPLHIQKLRELQHSLP